MTTPALPELPIESWEPTKDTLHLYAQIVGKVRLASTPPRNHWWHAPLYVDVRGLTTRRMHRAGITFELAFDFIDHRLLARTTDGGEHGFDLVDGLSVAEFDALVHTLLRGLGVDVELVEVPFGVPMTTPFPDDREHRSYDRDAVARFWRALLWIDAVFDEFGGWFCGKSSPVHLFWHSFDLALTRFSGRRAPALPDADPVTREAYTHEVVSFGFWAGDRDLREPAFYSYAAPEPAGLRETELRPAAAHWAEMPSGAIALLPYGAVRAAPDPRTVLLAFLQSAYEAGAQTAGWDRDALVSSFCPGPAELSRMLSA
jgi:hypothetical protein